MAREPNGIPAEDDDGSGGLRPPVGVHLDGLHSEARGGFSDSCWSALLLLAAASSCCCCCLAEHAEKAQPQTGKSRQ